MYDPSTDGITHINIYSKGVTFLGRRLSNFSLFNFKCIDGHFASIEGYWYWLSTHEEKLRYLWGWEAKKVGKELRKTHSIKDPDFENKIKEAIRIKSLEIKQLLIQSAPLPFVHYYNYGGKIHVPRDNLWVIEEWEILRKKYIEEA